MKDKRHQELLDIIAKQQEQMGYCNQAVKLLNKEIHERRH